MIEKKHELYMLPWEREAWEKGHEEGCEEERERAGRQAVVRVLEARFSPLPDAIRSGIEKVATAEHLTRLIEAAALAPALADFDKVLAELPKT